MSRNLPFTPSEKVTCDHVMPKGCQVWQSDISTYPSMVPAPFLKPWGAMLFRREALFDEIDVVKAFLAWVILYPPWANRSGQGSLEFCAARAPSFSWFLLSRRQSVIYPFHGAHDTPQLSSRLGGQTSPEVYARRCPIWEKSSHSRESDSNPPRTHVSHLSEPKQPPNLR